MTERHAILQEREKTHGSFNTCATVSQHLKAILRENGPVLVSQREALDMIAVKIARICAGDAKFQGHWEDIIGYAHLGAEACDE